MSNLKRPQIEFRVASDGRFGVLDHRGTKLTFSDTGSTNNTRVHVEGNVCLFQASQQQVLSSQGSWIMHHESRGVINEVLVQQRLRIVEGVQSGELDTVQVQYWLTNQSGRSQRVGLRLMLDTYIGNNDGVPFIVPGHEGLVDRRLVVERNQMPEFAQALERPDFINPGLMVNLTLRGNDAIRPDRLVISHWPGSHAEWDYSITDIGHDSAVGVYYQPRVLRPGERRPIVLFYGLGGLSSVASGNTRLAVIAPKVLPVGREGTIVVLVRDPVPGQNVVLTVEPPLALAYGQQAVKPVRGGGSANYCELAWRVQALDASREAARIEARLDPLGIKESSTIAITAKR